MFFLNGGNNHLIFPLKRRIFIKRKTERKKMRIYNNTSQAFSKERKMKIKAIGEVTRWGVGAAVTMRW
jgi:hypothetical protein